MKMFGIFALAFIALSFPLTIASWYYWNFIYTIADFWSSTYQIMLGVYFLAGICLFLAVTCLAIGLIVGPKKSADA